MSNRSKIEVNELKGESRSNGSKNKNKKKMNKGLKIFLIIILILAIIVAAITAAGWGMISEMQDEKIDENAIGLNDDTEKKLSGYRNIALLGIDSRQDDYGLGNRSDCIIIASINKSTNDVKLISVYRDSYLQLVEKGTTKLDKVTHAYSYGGAQNTLLALNTNLDLNIKEYLTVNFDTVVLAVDALGGVDIDITSDELKYINSYIDATSQSSGVSAEHITSPGKQKLSGVQAVAYSRIRYTSGGDYKRAERMRTVVQAMVTKAKSLSTTQLISFANKILPHVSTNISNSEIISLAPTLAKMNFSTSIGWPYETKGITLDRWYGVPVTLESNVVRLHKEVFGDSNYTVPDNIKKISDQIVSKTGYKESSSATETNNNK